MSEAIKLPQPRATVFEAHGMWDAGDYFDREQMIVAWQAGRASLPSLPRVTWAHEVGGPWRLELNGITVSTHRNKADMEAARASLTHALAAGRASTLPHVSEASLREIDLALAAMVDLKPLVEYGEPGTYDTVQARRRTALLRAERALLFLRRELSAAPAVTASPIKDQT